MVPQNNSPSLPSLPDRAQPILEAMNTGEPQGASRRIRQINDLFAAIADGFNGDSAQDLIAIINQTANYFILTRGRNTPAIRNAIRMTLHGLEALASHDVREVQDFIASRRVENNSHSIANADAIARYGANLLGGMDVVMPFDYSGSVMGILKRIADGGKSLKLVVTESRSIKGGRPIVEQATSMGHSVHFIVDLAFPSFMREIQAVLIGSETIFANGDCWNTVGGYAVSVIANLHQVPFYVATELIKIDPQSFLGVVKPIKTHNFSDLFDYPSSFSNPQLVNTIGMDLDNIPAKQITAYITEQGVLPPQSLYFAAKQFLEDIGGLEVDASLD